ncbi:hypothetical protein JNUCC83_05450 [Vagococcus sp. JNUCC 83]
MEKIKIEFTEDELTTICDWFNGFCFKNYGYDLSKINEKLPESHKLLIDRLLTKFDEFEE